jgi:hypothetical protein
MQAANTVEIAVAADYRFPLDRQLTDHALFLRGVLGAVVVLFLIIFFVRVGPGLHKGLISAWRANWWIVGLNGMWLLLRPNPFKLGAATWDISGEPYALRFFG